MGRLTNWMLFKIQRHPDHHTNAGRPYQILRTFKESPTMPTGYAGMFVLSWFPPLFAAIMDPLVENAYRQREIMESRGVAASAFPKGSNNMSSFFKKEGEGFYENDANAAKAVWDEKYDELYDGLVKQGARPLVVSRHLGSIRVSGARTGSASSKSSHGEKKKSR